MTAPFGQPEPFDPASVTGPVRRTPPRSNRLLLPIVAAVALALVAFAGGYVVANATGSNTAGTGRTAFNDDGGGGFAPGASFRTRGGGPGGFGGFGGGAAGTVGSVSADQMTITTANGGSRIVLLTPSTTVDKITSTTQAVTDITSGETVTVVGTANPDGSVTATRIIIGNVGILGGRGGFGGPEASPSTAP
jgi:hypothetical protein